MFERYTEKARRVIFFAQYEARGAGSPSIDTEHLLLGVLREDKALSIRFIRSYASLESMLKQIKDHTVTREKIATNVDLPLSNESKRVLNYAAEEAKRLGHKHIGSEHLFMGLLREEECLAAKILEGQGIKLARIREELSCLPQEGITDVRIKHYPDDPAWQLIVAGVKINRPETCVIDLGVEVAPGTTIEPYVQLLGKTRVGANCRIRSFTVIENCALGNNVLIRQNCVLEDSKVADGAEIGPFVHLRPGCEIGENAHLGNFVEMKKARIGKGSKANHLSYIGDAEVGEKTNIGAGTITCNYDGAAKHRTQIGNGVFVGSDTSLVAPITIGDGAYIGAGSCITKDVPADALAVARGRQVTKEGWAAQRRARRNQKP